jgi:hypothetical protein
MLHSKVVAHHIYEILRPHGALIQYTPGIVTVLTCDQIIGKTGVSSPPMNPTADCRVPCI